MPPDLTTNFQSEVQHQSRLVDSVNHFLKLTKIKKFYIDSLMGDVYLTRKEAEIAGWLILGKSSLEISMILNSKERTIEKHLEKIRKKLACNKTTQIIKILVDSKFNTANIT